MQAPAFILFLCSTKWFYIVGPGASTSIQIIFVWPAAHWMQSHVPLHVHHQLLPRVRVHVVELHDFGPHVSHVRSSLDIAGKARCALKRRDQNMKNVRLHKVAKHRGTLLCAHEEVRDAAIFQGAATSAPEQHGGSIGVISTRRARR